MRGLKTIWPACLPAVLLISLFADPCFGQFLDYTFEGVITEVTENENDVVPGLAVGDTFFGSLRFDSQGWQNTAGVVSVFLNGVDLRFEGDSIFGGLSIDPFYSFRIAADQAGAGADIRNSTFAAFNFGIRLEDMDPSDQYNETFPVFIGPDEYETNVVSISGSVIASGDRVNAVGRVTSLNQLIVDCFGDVDGDFDTDVDDINRFADVLGESALFNRCFDLDGDGVITLDDHDVAIDFFATTSSGANGTFVGDVNFDGRVDVLNDAFILVANLGTPGPHGYQDGDLNADNEVDVVNDAFRLVANLGQSVE